MYLGMMVFNECDKVPVYIPKLNQADYIKAKARTMILDINVLEEKQIHRYRFTVGHECGHDMEHYEYFGFYSKDQISIFSDSPQPLICCREVYEYKNKEFRFWTEKDRIEWQANYTSSALQMPKSKVLEVSRDVPIKEETEKQKLITWISKIFNVSEEAAKYRLEDLGIIKDFSNSIL